MNYKIVLLSIICLICLIGPVMAADYQIPVNSSTNTYINVSYKLANTTATPFFIWIFVAAAGLYMMVISFITRKNDDIFAYLATPLLGLATYQSLTLDVITSSGVTSQAGSLFSSEVHTLYSITGLTIIFVILFIVSLINIYRVIMLNRSESDEPEYRDSDR